MGGKEFHCIHIYIYIHVEQRIPLLEEITDVGHAMSCTGKFMQLIFARDLPVFNRALSIAW